MWFAPDAARWAAMRATRRPRGRGWSICSVLAPAPSPCHTSARRARCANNPFRHTPALLGIMGLVTTALMLDADDPKGTYQYMLCRNEFCWPNVRPIMDWNVAPSWKCTCVAPDVKKRMPMRTPTDVCRPMALALQRWDPGQSAFLCTSRTKICKFPEQTLSKETTLLATAASLRLFPESFGAKLFFCWSTSATVHDANTFTNQSSRQGYSRHQKGHWGTSYCLSI